ncbi:MAG TPA: PEP-CTERM sorting domain-containing protein [Micropepsaceae bacterium]|nr:PEP-CTERM sorting domain-containing protein [Micropepsaceae bacterium]
MRFHLLKVSAFALAAVAGCNAISASPAMAGTVTETFNFDNMGNSVIGYNNISSYTVQSYMAGVLNSTTGFTNTSSVGVNGALGQQGTGSYTGDNHVIGPTIGGTVHPLTLGDTNNSAAPNTDTSKWDASTPTLNSTDGFLKNCTGIDAVTNNATSATGCYTPSGTNAASPDIFLDFSSIRYQGHQVEIASFSFDFEIFPDGTCTADTFSGCGGAMDANGHRPNLPDLELWSGNNATGHYFQTWWGTTPAGTNNDSVAMTNETAPQLLGVSGTFNVDPTLHLTSLDFMDWPETIGIDNLVVTFRTVPEPASIAFLALALGGAFLLVVRRNRRRDDDAIAGKKA